MLPRPCPHSPPCSPLPCGYLVLELLQSQCGNAARGLLQGWLGAVQDPAHSVPDHLGADKGSVPKPHPSLQGPPTPSPSCSEDTGLTLDTAPLPITHPILRSPSVAEEICSPSTTSCWAFPSLGSVVALWGHHAQHPLPGEPGPHSAPCPVPLPRQSPKSSAHLIDIVQDLQDGEDAGTDEEAHLPPDVPWGR